VRRELLHKRTGLGDAELRVYLFLVGQTMGWGDDTDDISLSQISRGIRRKSGEVWCTGTGLSARAIITAVRNLTARGLITVTNNLDVKKGKVANTYALCLKETPPDDP
jgi:predicted RNA-binding protein with EMAP domain